MTGRDLALYLLAVLGGSLAGTVIAWWIFSFFILS